MGVSKWIELKDRTAVKVRQTATKKNEWLLNTAKERGFNFI